MHSIHIFTSDISAKVLEKLTSLQLSSTREQGSLGVYKALKKQVAAFQNDKKRKITFLGIDYTFFQDFQNYLITHRGLIRDILIDKFGKEERAIHLFW
jgi:hypothetical protein